jgi:hypothetical protein
VKAKIEVRPALDGGWKVSPPKQLKAREFTTRQSAELYARLLGEKLAPCVIEIYSIAGTLESEISIPTRSGT